MAATPGYPRKAATIRPDMPAKSAFRTLPHTVFKVQPGPTMKRPVAPTRPVVRRPVTPKPAPIDPGLAALNAVEKRHIGQATRSRDWLANILGTLGQTQAQSSNATLGLLGTAAGTYQAAGQATSPFIQSASPGGFVPQMQAQPELGAARAQAAVQAPSIQQALAQQGNLDVSQSLIAQAAKYATDLPSVYADKRNKYMADLAEFREKVRQFNVAQTNKQLATVATANTAAANRQSREAIAQAQIEAANARASQSDQTRRDLAAAKGASSGVGGFRNMTPENYAKAVQTSVADARKLYESTVTNIGEDGKKVYTKRTPSSVFSILRDEKGLRPMDAARIALSSAPVDIGPNIVIQWMHQSFPGDFKRARAAAKQILGPAYDAYVGSLQAQAQSSAAAAKKARQKRERDAAARSAWQARQPGLG